MERLPYKTKIKQGRTALKIAVLGIKMFYPLTSLAIAVLFFVLTPGVLVSLPSGKGKFVVAATHAVIFALVFHFTNKAVLNFTQQYELFEGAAPACAAPGSKPADGASCCLGSVNPTTGMC